MAPRVTNWDDLAFALERTDPHSNTFQYTSFGLIDDTDTFYYGQINAPKSEISLHQLTAALTPVPDNTILTLWPGAPLREAPETQSATFIKRAAFEVYDFLKQRGIEKQLSGALVAEAHVLEELSHHPHPNLVRYRGCQVKRGYITGLVLDRHPHDLLTYVQRGYGTIDEVPFMAALESVIGHLHGLGYAHNDLDPSNVMVSEAGMPVLIDFDGCQKLGTELKHTRGTKDWIEGEIEDHNVSEVRHDIYALGKIRAWLDNPDLLR